MRSSLPRLLAAVVLAVAGPVWGQTDPETLARSVRERCEAQGLPAESARQLLRPVAQASEQGLPADSVADKVLEGLAKRVAPDRIVRAADEVRARLETAQAALSAAGVAVPALGRRLALDRLALAVQASDPQSVLELSREAKGASAADLILAARQLGELKSRGVGPESISALATLARAGMPNDIERLARLLDEYRAEGGADVVGLLEEVRGRAEQHRSLDDLIDPFADGPDPLRHSAKSHGHRDALPDAATPGRGNSSESPGLEKSGRSGSTPGFDLESPARKAKGCNKKNKPGCI
jgi:hypothetical protein